MSLLDKASLIVTPNAYKESKLYSVVPSSGAGDMDVVRATTATRVNSAGLIEVVPRNIYTYSNDFTNSVWTKFQSTITNNQLGYDGTNNASLLVEDSTTNAHLLLNTPILSGQTTISVYAKSNTRNWLYIRGVQAAAPVVGWFNLSNGTLGTIQTNGTGSITSVGNGWYRCSLTIANFDTGFETYIGISNANNVTSYLGNGSSIFIQNAQVEQGSTATDYFPTTTRLNIPRIDYTNGSCPSLLVEPQRTNLLTYSNDFTNINWIKITTTITSNYAISPDGTQNASRVQFTAANSQLYQLVGLQSSSVSSFYVKGTAGQTVAIYNSANGGGLYELRTLTGQWQRIQVASTGSIISYSAISNFFGATATEFLIYGAQFEIGSYPTSYIPTVASSVTRNADVISKTGISSLIGQTEGTVFLDFVARGGDINQEILGVTLTGGGAQYIALYSLTNGALYFISNITGAILINSNSFNNRYKVAYSFIAGNHVLYVNGTQISTSSSSTVYSLLNAVYLGVGADGSGIQLLKTNSLQLYKTKLSNTELAQLTTL